LQDVSCIVCFGRSIYYNASLYFQYSLAILPLNSFTWCWSLLSQKCKTTKISSNCA